MITVVLVRWPFIKGMYYRTAATEAASITIPWQHDLGAALAEARRSGRPVLVDFSASWCPPCIAMKHDVWTDPAVEHAVTANFVPLMIDVDQDPGTSERFDIDTIPTILVLDGRGRVIRRAGYLPVSGVLRFVAGS